jgi:twitching motility protein PilT
MDEYFNIIQFLRNAVASGASDEHIKVGYPPFIRKNGFIKKTNMPIITKEDLDKAILEIAPIAIRDEILTKCDVDFMYEIKGCSRFRINYNRQIGLPGMVIRNIAYNIPTLAELSLPEILNSIIQFPNGIILVTGPTGSGKSTTIASLINQINITSSKHIITIEDPIEYVFGCKKSIVSQRQVGVDTKDFSDGIKYALRQDPDVIFIGEIRDQETMEAALKASETGHLVLSTLHTNDAVQTINRIVNMFDESNRYLIRKQLAETLRSTVSQKLVFSEKDNRRYPACEIMTVTSTIKDYITKDNTEEIYELLKDNTIDNMISMNSSLALLTEKGYITESEALSNSNDEPELEKIFRGVYQGTKAYYD